MPFVKLWTFLVILSGTFLLNNNANACSWASPAGITSKWVEDKVVFWGRPIETKWNKLSNDELTNFQAVTRIEVLEPVKGKIPKTINVHHSMIAASCGVVFQMGNIELFALPKQQNGVFSTESHVEEAVSKHILFAYFNEGEDIPLKEIADLKNSFYMDSSPCEKGDENQKDKPSYCKWEKAFFGYSEAYSNKVSQLNVEDIKKKWWQKFWR